VLQGPPPDTKENKNKNTCLIAAVGVAKAGRTIFSQNMLNKKKSK